MKYSIVAYSIIFLFLVSCNNIVGDSNAILKNIVNEQFFSGINSGMMIQVGSELPIGINNNSNYTIEAITVNIFVDDEKSILKKRYTQHNENTIVVPITQDITSGLYQIRIDVAYYDVKFVTSQTYWVFITDTVFAIDTLIVSPSVLLRNMQTTAHVYVVQNNGLPLDEHHLKTLYVEWYLNKKLIATQSGENALQTIITAPDVGGIYTIEAYVYPFSPKDLNITEFKFKSSLVKHFLLYVQESNIDISQFSRVPKDFYDFHNVFIGLEQGYSLNNTHSLLFSMQARNNMQNNNKNAQKNIVNPMKDIVGNVINSEHYLHVDTRIVPIGDAAWNIFELGVYFIPLALEKSDANGISLVRSVYNNEIFELRYYVDASISIHIQHGNDVWSARTEAVLDAQDINELRIYGINVYDDTVKMEIPYIILYSGVNIIGFYPILLSDFSFDSSIIDISDGGGYSTIGNENSSYNTVINQFIITEIFMKSIVEQEKLQQNYYQYRQKKEKLLFAELFNTELSKEIVRSSSDVKTGNDVLYIPAGEWVQFPQFSINDETNMMLRLVFDTDSAYKQSVFSMIFKKANQVALQNILTMHSDGSITWGDAIIGTYNKSSNFHDMVLHLMYKKGVISLIINDKVFTVPVSPKDIEYIQFMIQQNSEAYMYSAVDSFFVYQHTTI